MVLVESVFLNTPIISTDVGVAKELIKNYRCGDLISYDEHELASVILEYIKQHDRNPRKRNFNIGKDFSLQKELEQTMDIIEQTIDKSVQQAKLKQLPYPTEKIDYSQLEEYKIKENLLYILEVTKDDVKYEYLINRKLDNNKLIVFNNGAVAGGNVKFPVFQRHSWAKDLKTSSILCMDPTLYINGLLAGWEIGKNENYYLENSSLILKQIISKMNIKLTDTVIYGTSAGGLLSIMMGIYLKGAKVVADNSQLILSNWIVKPALDSVIFYCFDNIVDSLNYVDRFDIVESFKKHEYVPKIYIHVNMCSEADNSKQLVPFLIEMEKVKGYQDIEVVLHYEETKGHNGLDKEEAIKCLYDVLEME